MSVNTAKMKSKALIFLLLILIILFVNPLLAHEEDEEKNQETNELKIIENTKSNSLFLIGITSTIALLAVAISIFYKRKTGKIKILLFLIITIPIIITTIYLAGATLYLNKISETNGPVHYHADFEIWNCNEKINLIAPRGLLNRVGSNDFHEHDDDRIHVEGTIIKKEDISLHHFFDVVGSSLSENQLTIPTDSGLLQIKSPGFCNEKKAEIQVFLYKITNPDPKKKSGFLYKQEKLRDFESYIISPYQNIPPGDCIIIEFSEPKEKTEKICESYKLSLQKGDLNEA